MQIRFFDHLHDQYELNFPIIRYTHLFSESILTQKKLRFHIFFYSCYGVLLKLSYGGTESVEELDKLSRDPPCKIHKETRFYLIAFYRFQSINEIKQIKSVTLPYFWWDRQSHSLPRHSFLGISDVRFEEKLLSAMHRDKYVWCVARFNTKRLKMAFQGLAKTTFYLVRMR